MDTLKNNTNNEQAQDTQDVSNEINTIVNQEVLKDKELAIKPENIHAMPAKFLPQSSKKQFSAKQKIVLAVVGFVLFLIVVVGAMLWWANTTIPSSPISDVNVAPPANIPEENELEEEVPEETPPPVLSHDEKMNADLNIISQALDQYESDFGNFPASLSVLYPQYLEEIPRQANGSSYNYTALDQGNNFRFFVEFTGDQNPNFVGVFYLTKNGLTTDDPEEEEGNSTLPPPPPPPPGNNVNNNDIDQDQLTTEEESLYNTDPNDSDSDNDGYLDGTELVNLYSPIASGESLLNSGLVTVFTSTEFAYRIWYPSAWVAAEGPLEGSVIIAMDSESGDEISIVVQEYIGELTIEERLAEISVQHPELVTTTLGQENLVARQTPDQQTISYLTDCHYFPNDVK